MSTTQTQTVPELSIFTRVASIPLVKDSLSAVHSTLIGNNFTSSPYTLAQNLSKSAYQYSEPIQIRLAPALIRADSYANMGFDAMESRYPAPFKVTVDDIKQDFNQRSDSVHRTIDERVRNPAYNVAQAIDQVRRFASYHSSTKYEHIRNLLLSSITSKELSLDFSTRTEMILPSPPQMPSTSINAPLLSRMIFASSSSTSLPTSSNNSSNKAF
jgi:hypothetical protein